MQTVFSRPTARFLRVFTGRFFVLAGLCFGFVSAHALSLDDVAKLARDRAQTPYRQGHPALPAELTGLEYDGLRDIRFKDDKALWRAEQLPYEAKFFHVGRQAEPVRIHELSATGNKLLRYSPEDFTYGKNQLSPARWGDIGYAGFRIHTSLNSPA